MEDWKIKIATLWILFEFAMFTAPIVEQYIPGYVEEAIAQTTREMLVFLAFVMMIPPIMAFLSLTLKDSINWWVNMIVGIVFVVLSPASLGLFGFPTDYLAPMILITIVEVVAAVLIVWFAWKSKQKA